MQVTVEAVNSRSNLIVVRTGQDELVTHSPSRLKTATNDAKVYRAELQPNVQGERVRITWNDKELNLRSKASLLSAEQRDPLVKDRPWYTATPLKSTKPYPATHSNCGGKMEACSLSSVVLGGKPVTTYAVNGERDNLDCRRTNLRDVFKAQSSWRNAKRTDNKTGATGVYWVKDKQRYIAKLVTIGVLKHIGSFKTEKDAAAASMRRHLVCVATSQSIRRSIVRADLSLTSELLRSIDPAR